MDTNFNGTRARPHLVEVVGPLSTRGRPGALMWPAPLLLIALSACGGGRAEYPCSTAGNALGYVSAEEPIDCAAFNADAENALAMLANTGIAPADAQHVFERLSVVVEKGPTIEGHSEDFGWYDGETETAYVTESGRALLHEMLHHWERMHWVLNTGDHPDWCAKGYGQWDDCPQSLDWLFNKSAQPLGL